MPGSPVPCNGSSSTWSEGGGSLVRSCDHMGPPTPGMFFPCMPGCASSSYLLITLEYTCRNLSAQKNSTLGGNRTSLLVHLPEDMSSVIRSPYYQGDITHVNQSPITHGRDCLLLVQIAYTPCPPNSLVTIVMLPRQFVMDLFYISLVHTIPDPRISSSTAAAPDD